MKKIYALLMLVLAGTAHAQNEEDALRYSAEGLGGTARSMSMAGSMSALGGDFSAVLQNPAAMGKFIKKNFSFTPFIEQNVVSANYMGNTVTQNRSNMKVGNISLVKSYELDPRLNNNWISFQLGAGYNRTQSFNERFEYSGNSETSIIDYFINEGYGIAEDDISGVNRYSSGLAYLTFAIDPFIGDDGTTFYTSNKSGTSIQNRSVESEGGMGEFNFTASANYKNKLLVGGSLNFVTLNYYTAFDHTETFDKDNSFINFINYTGYLDVDGSGINARVGAIYMPTNYLRIGAAVETPTRLSMHENFGNNMQTDDDITLHSLTGNPGPPSGSFDYIIRTPLKANASMAFIYKKIGSISAEVEMVDYASSHMKSVRNSGLNFYSFQAENEQINNLYKTAYNIKVGAEARITPKLYVRGGYAQFQSAYKVEKQIFDPAVQFYTGGLGYNFGLAYIDFATVVKNSQNNYIAYDPTMEGSTARLERQKVQYVLTFGVRF